MTTEDAARGRPQWVDAVRSGLVLLVAVVVIAVVVSVGDAAEAARQRDAAEARLLATRADDVFAVDPQRAVLLALAGAGVAETDEGHDALVRAAEHQHQVLGYLDAHDDRVRDIAFAPAGDLLATAGVDGVVRLWAMPGRAPVGELAGAATGDIAFSPDGGTLYAAGASEIAVWDVATRSRRSGLASGHSPRSLAVSPDGSLVAQGGLGGEVLVWEAAAGRQRHLLPGIGGMVSTVAFSPDGRLLLAGAADGSVTLWDSATAAVVDVWDGFASGSAALAFSPDGTVAAYSGAEAGTVEVRQVVDGVVLATIPGYGTAIEHLRFLDQQVLLAATSDGALLTVDLVTGEQQEYVGPLADVTAVAISQDLRTVASGAHDGAVAVWDAGRTGAAPVGAVLGELLAMAVHPSGDVVAAADAAGTTVLRDVRPGAGVAQPDQVLTGDGQANGVAFARDGSALAVVHGSGTTLLWRLGAGNPQQQAALRADAGAVAAAFSPDGAVLAVGLFDGRVELWDTASATRVGTLQDQALPGGMAIAFSPDGRTLAAASVDGVGLWDVAARTRIRTLDGSSRLGTTGLAFSPDGTRLAQAGMDGRVVLWTLRDDGEDGLAVLPGHRERVTAVAFSPDGRTLASGDTAGLVVLSDTGTLAQRAVLSGALITGVGFRANGTGLVATTYGGEVLRWDLDAAALRERLCGIVGRDLDPAEWARYLPDRPQQPVCPR
ncbi:WD40 repeat domain-containing protein [Pseudonocardia humida]|uniref:WD40 repeat domain-containing protein n=1 Tax=Pseudonocardia humida TaxID=2800819 RepID=A0ABT0ZYB4_9PSEU|nr:WD40 repeat domain-containing protein [Pseudonocardia humida]MCO1655609.1 WD40 repeat domain-containing protein [Pseudonocardia humida]